MEKHWKLKEKADPSVVEQLQEELKVNRIVALLLAQRGISTFKEARKFFRPELSDLHNPFLMKGMKAAIERIERAISNDEKILVYGDYDVDGTTAVAFTYSFFIDKHRKLDYYIPDRYAEGYGISYQGINHAAENGFSLIIALDCGIRAVEKVQYAKEKGLDFIICDHHLPGENLPDAVAVLDPKQPGCGYPFKELSGCGIAFKLAQAFTEKHALSQEKLLQNLELVAVSIAADIVPIVDENRVLAFHGLEKLNREPSVGIQTLIGLSGSKKKEMSISDVVFMIGPRINAAGRIDHGKRAVELLVSQDPESSQELAKGIDGHNVTRKNLDKSITQQALSMIEEDISLQQRKSTVVFHPEWHKGVIGIVASRLIEKHYRPTIVLSEADGYATGSARSVKGFNVYKAIEACGDLLEQFGGHKYAAGLKMRVENIEAFSNRFEEVVATSIEEHMLVPTVEIDMELALEQITPKFIRILKQFSPFGPGNMKPVFITKHVIDKGHARIVGDNHLKLNVCYPDNQRYNIAAIAFNQGHHYLKISQGIPFDVCYTIEENHWNGQVTLQLNVKDIKF